MSSKESSRWQAHLDRITQEGISIKAYAEREGLSAQSLYQWRYELKRRAGSSSPRASESRASRQFVQVLPEPVSAQPLRCCLVLPSGLRLEMSDLPATRWVSDLIHELDGGLR